MRIQLEELVRRDLDEAFSNMPLSNSIVKSLPLLIALLPHKKLGTETSDRHPCVDSMSTQVLDSARGKLHGHDVFFLHLPIKHSITSFISRPLQYLTTTSGTGRVRILRTDYDSGDSGGRLPGSVSVLSE